MKNSLMMTVVVSLICMGVAFGQVQFTDDTQFYAVGGNGDPLDFKDWGISQKPAGMSIDQYRVSCQSNSEQIA